MCVGWLGLCSGGGCEEGGRLWWCGRVKGTWGLRVTE